MESTAFKIFKSTVKVENENIWIKPVCDFFNLHVQNQYIKIKNDPILGKLYGKNSTDLGEIDNNGRILLSRKGFIRWINIILQDLQLQYSVLGSQIKLTRKALFAALNHRYQYAIPFESKKKELN